MGESACLMQPFSYTSGFPNEAREGNPIHSLGQSISFGKFMSESLDWEKWSTFSNNRYVEEAEKFSRPGSVAQKKAFFEAHYKKIAAQKAAALREQENAASDNVSEQKLQVEAEKVGTSDSQTTISKPYVVYEQEVKALTEEDTDEYNVSVDTAKCDENNVEGAKPVIEHDVFVENLNPVIVELPSQHVDVGDSSEVKETELNQTTQMDKPLDKTQSSNCNLMDPAAISTTKPSLSSSKLSILNRASKFPHSPEKPNASTLKNTTPTRNAKRPSMESADKRRSTPKSHGLSVNFTPIRELNKLTSTVMRKIERSRIGASSTKVSKKDCPTPLRTPTTVLKSDAKRHLSTTPWSEKRGSSKFLSTCRKITRSPFPSTPFSLRTEERAARRKEKLEEKFNANQAQNLQHQTELKDKAETEIRKFRQTLCFKARPLPEFYKERKEQKNEIKKVPVLHPRSPKLGRKQNPSTGDGATASLPTQKPSVKNSSNCKNNVKGKTHSLTLRSIMAASENTSPNIQQSNLKALMLPKY